MNTGFDDTWPISFWAWVCDSQACVLCLSKDACSCPIPQPKAHCFQPQRAAVGDRMRLWPAAGLAAGCSWNSSPGWCAALQEPGGASSSEVYSELHAESNFKRLAGNVEGWAVNGSRGDGYSQGRLNSLGCQREGGQPQLEGAARS